MAADKEPTVIKKYANRRLYHTGTSSYVTLEDLALLVRGGEEFVVVDAKSGEDITRSVLAQIIFEEESKTGQNLLPITFLRQLIRFYGDSMQALVPSYLEFSIDTLTREQQKLRDAMAQQMSQAWPKAPWLGVMEEQTRTNMAMFERAFRMFSPFSPPANADVKQPEAASEDIDGLRRELADMKSRLDKMAPRKD